MDCYVSVMEKQQVGSTLLSKLPWYAGTFKFPLIGMKSTVDFTQIYEDMGGHILLAI